MYVVVVHVIVALQIHDLLHACSVYTRRIRPSYNCSEVVEEEVRRQTGWDWLKEELEVTVRALRRGEDGEGERGAEGRRHMAACVLSGMLRKPKTTGGADQVIAALDAVADEAAAATNRWLEVTRGSAVEDVVMWGEQEVGMARRIAGAHGATLFGTGELVVDRPRECRMDGRRESMEERRIEAETSKLAGRSVKVESRLRPVAKARLRGYGGGRPPWWEDSVVGGSEDGSRETPERPRERSEAEYELRAMLADEEPGPRVRALSAQAREEVMRGLDKGWMEEDLIERHVRKLRESDVVHSLTMPTSMSMSTKLQR